MIVHYASRKSRPCPTADRGMPLQTACGLTVSALPWGEMAREDINAVTCEECLSVHGLWVDMANRPTVTI